MKIVKVNGTPLVRLISTELQTILGDDELYVPRAEPTHKLRNGTRVYSIVASPNTHDLCQRDGQIMLWERLDEPDEDGRRRRLVPINSCDELREYKKTQHSNGKQFHMGEWEFLTFTKGPLNIEAQLQERLTARCPFPLTVEIGRNGANPCSVSVKVPPHKQQFANGPSAIELLFAQLPPPGSEWPMAERTKWLQQVNTVFDLMYRNE